MEHNRQPVSFGVLIQSVQMNGKAVDKAELQKGTGPLTVEATTPLFGSITRLADQKGLDIQLGALEEMLSMQRFSWCFWAAVPRYTRRPYQELAR